MVPSSMAREACSLEGPVQSSSPARLAWWLEMSGTDLVEPLKEADGEEGG